MSHCGFFSVFSSTTQPTYIWSNIAETEHERHIKAHALFQRRVQLIIQIDAWVKNDSLLSVRTIHESRVRKHISSSPDL